MAVSLREDNLFRLSVWLYVPLAVSIASSSFNFSRRVKIVRLILALPVLLWQSWNARNCSSIWLLILSTGLIFGDILGDGLSIAVFGGFGVLFFDNFCFDFGGLILLILFLILKG